MQPTYDELLHILEEQRKTNDEQRKIINRLKKRIAELEEWLGLIIDIYSES